MRSSRLEQQRAKAAQLEADVQAYLARGGTIGECSAFDNVEYIKTTTKGKPHVPHRIRTDRG